MNFQKLKSKNTCSASAAGFMFLMVGVAVMGGQDVLGIGQDIPLIVTVIIIFVILVGLLIICTLFKAFRKWLFKKMESCT